VLESTTKPLHNEGEENLGRCCRKGRGGRGGREGYANVMCRVWELRVGEKGTCASWEVPRCPRVIRFIFIFINFNYFNFILNPLGFNYLKHFFLIF